MDKKKEENKGIFLRFIRKDKNKRDLIRADVFCKNEDVHKKVALLLEEIDKLTK